jgi:hypothetical protein
MMLKRSLVGALVALALPVGAVAVAGPAVADVAITPITDCSTGSVTQGIVDLLGAVATLVIAGQNAEKDRATLQGKLSAAFVKIGESKPVDAAPKLTDFRAKIILLRDAGRISATDAAPLVAAGDAIVGCLGGTV